MTPYRQIFPGVLAYTYGWQLSFAKYSDSDVGRAPAPAADPLIGLRHSITRSSIQLSMMPGSWMGARRDQELRV